MVTVLFYVLFVGLGSLGIILLIQIEGFYDVNYYFVMLSPPHFSITLLDICLVGDCEWWCSYLYLLNSYNRLLVLRPLFIEFLNLIGLFKLIELLKFVNIIIC